jgi:hypothetical protein
MRPQRVPNTDGTARDQLGFKLKKLYRKQQNCPWEILFVFLGIPIEPNSAGNGCRVAWRGCNWMGGVLIKLKEERMILGSRSTK